MLNVFGNGGGRYRVRSGKARARENQGYSRSHIIQPSRLLGEKIALRIDGHQGDIPKGIDGGEHGRAFHAALDLEVSIIANGGNKPAAIADGKLLAGS